MTALNKTELQKYKKSGYLTVGNLKKFIEKYNLPDDAIVVVQRIQDVYYEKHGWSVYTKPSEESYWMKSHNDKVDSGYYADKENFPDEHPIHTLKYTQEEMDSVNSQYHPVWSPVFYSDDNDILFLDLHY